MPNIKDTFAESLHPRMSIMHLSMRILKAGPPSLSDDWGNYQEKIPDVSDPVQNAETCNSKLKFTELKDIFNKRVQKN